MILKHFKFHLELTYIVEESIILVIFLKLTFKNQFITRGPRLKSLQSFTSCFFQNVNYRLIMRANDLALYKETLGRTTGIFLFVCGKITRDAINPTSPFHIS